MKRLLIVICTTFAIAWCTHATAQSKRQWEKYGDLSFNEKDYYGAARYYKEALEADSNDVELLYKYANSLRLFNNYELAEPAFTRLYKIDKGTQYPDALFWLATMQKFNARYDEAITTFKRYLSSTKDKDSFEYKKATNEIGSCKFAKELLKDTLPISIHNIGAPMNTENADFGALPLEDTLVLFSSLRAEKVIEYKKKKEKLYKINLYLGHGRDTVWDRIEEIDTLLSNAGHHIANGTFSKNRRWFYYTVCDKALHCQLYRAEQMKGQWLRTEKLPDPVNLEGTITTQPMLAQVEGREVLFFVSDREGGQGRLDIWYSILQAGSFSSPINLGPTINTIDDEITPFYDDIEKALYFSSAWHWGLGGQDIFRSEGSLLNLSKPVNLGYPINSSANDLYYVTNKQEKTGYLSSNRPGSITKKGETCCNDIWYYRYLPQAPPVEEPIEKPSSAIVSLEKINNKLPLSLYFHNDRPGPRSNDTVVAQTFAQTLDEYLTLREEYLQKNTDSIGRKELTAFFDQEISTSSERLNEVVTYLLEALEQGNGLTVYVKGFASPLAKTRYNLYLSQRRISTFINQLKQYQNGILIPYLEGASPRLRIESTPLGEYTAGETISDDPADTHRSIFALAAAKERRIEISHVLPDSSNGAYASLSPYSNNYDFGKIKEGSKVRNTFNFRNTGNDYLNILNVKASCGCTMVNWTKEPIAPGAVGQFDIEFDTSGKRGKQHKEVLVETNAWNSRTVFNLTGEVE